MTGFQEPLFAAAKLDKLSRKRKRVLDDGVREQLRNRDFKSYELKPRAWWSRYDWKEYNDDVARRTQ